MIRHSQVHYRLQPPLRSYNITYLRFDGYRQRIEYLRTDYIKWLVHFFGEQLSTLQLVEATRHMTLQTFELLMQLRIHKLESVKAQEKAKEEERQKKLLERLKSAQMPR